MALRSPVSYMYTNVFVYGTLLQRFTNFERYLGPACRAGCAAFVGAGRTVERLPLVVRLPEMPPKTCGPVLMHRPGMGHCVPGEIYKVDNSVLAALDRLEGVASGAYYRKPTEIEADGSMCQCEVYFFRETAELLALPLLPAYTASEHARYSAPSIDDEIVRLCTTSEPALTLTYLDVRGRGEAIRLAFVLGGVPFKDERVGYDEVQRRRASGELPGGQVPVLHVRGCGAYSQSQAILRYAGRLSGLYPTDDLELAMACDGVLGMLADLHTKLAPLWYGAALGRSPVDGRTLVPLSDAQRESVERALNSEVLPTMLGRLERLMASSVGNYFCGDRMLTCDLELFVLTTELLSGTYADGRIGAAVLDECPKLRAHQALVASHPRVRSYYSSRA